MNFAKSSWFLKLTISRMDNAGCRLEDWRKNILTPEHFFEAGKEFSDIQIQALKRFQINKALQWVTKGKKPNVLPKCIMEWPKI